MNAEAVVSSQFHNNASDTTVSKDTEKGAAGSELFLRLILAMMAEAQGQREMAKREMLDLAGMKHTDLVTFSEQNASEKSNETSADLCALGALLGGNQNIFQNLPLQEGEPPKQSEQQGNAELCGSQKLGQEGILASQAGPLASLFSLAPEKVSEQPAERPLENLNSCLPITKEISELSATSLKDGSGENNQPSSKDQLLLQGSHDREDWQFWDLNKNKIQPEKLRLNNKETEVELFQKEHLEEISLSNSKFQKQRPYLREETVEQKVLKQATQISLKPSEDSSKGNAALQGSQQEFIRSVPFLPSELSREQPDAAVARDVIKQVVDQAHLFVGRNVASLKLQLKPEFLGNLKLTISVEHGMVHARFTADNAAVANLIETRLPELQHALSDRGITWHQFSVSVDTQAHSGGFDYPRQEGTGYQHPYPYAFMCEPSAHEDYLEQGAASHPGGRWVVDYLV